jgi:hypothetical protein
MTDAEWLAATDPASMLEFVRGRANDRQLRLFASAVCGGVEMVDRYLDGRATFEQMAEVGLDVARCRGDHAQRWRAEASNVACSGDIRRVVVDVLRLVLEADRWDRRGGGPAYAGVARCVFGNPFRPAVLDPSWLTPTVVALAEGIGADRAFDRLPILADALEDAGCADRAVLDHCRSPGPHVRGCWALDLLLGKG